MQDRMRNLCAGAAMIIAAAGSVAAQDNQVRLETIEGDTSMAGKLIGFEDGVYSLQTGFGLFQIPAESVVCTGTACPRIGPERLTVAVGGAFLAEALGGALQDFASSRDSTLVAGDASGAGRRLDLRKAGATMAEITLQRVAGLSTLRAADWAAAGIDIALLAQPAGALRPGRLLGTDAVVALVHADNPVRALSPADLARVLEGTVSDWSQLGGPKAAIEIVMPAAGTLGAGAVTAVLGQAGPDRAEERALAEIPARVARDPAALGLTLWSGRGNGGRALAVAGPCGAVVAPDAFTVGSGLYPLRADIVIRTDDEDLPRIAGALAAYLASDAARPRLVAAGVPAAAPVAGLPVGQQGDYLVGALAGARDAAELEQLQVLFADVADARQLSTVYYFASNATRGEPEHDSLTVALADYLSGLDPEATEVLLLGFSDELETGGRRVGLSRMRAEYVRTLIGGAAADFSARIRTAGFEGLAPRGCNREVGGRALNRRVEVWVRGPG